MSPEIQVLVVPGSLFCIKVLVALHYKNLDYTLRNIHPTKLKKELPAPHQVPVMLYDGKTIADSKAILKFIDQHHNSDDKPLYPDIAKGKAAGKHWSDVEQLETFSHDVLSMLYFYFGGISKQGVKNVTRPFVKGLLPSPVVTVLPFLPILAAKHASATLTKRVKPILGENVIASDAAAKQKLRQSLMLLESSFENAEQAFLFDTNGPTAADFGVYAALKRLAHPLPDVGAGLQGGFPSVFEELGPFPRLQKFFKLMDDRYYNGKVDWSKTSSM